MAEVVVGDPDDPPACLLEALTPLDILLENPWIGTMAVALVLDGHSFANVREIRSAEVASVRVVHPVADHGFRQPSSYDDETHPGLARRVGATPQVQERFASETSSPSPGSREQDSKCRECAQRMLAPHEIVADRHELVECEPVGELDPGALRRDHRETESGPSAHIEQPVTSDSSPSRHGHPLRHRDVENLEPLQASGKGHEPEASCRGMAEPECGRSDCSIGVAEAHKSGEMIHGVFGGCSHPSKQGVQIRSAQTARGDPRITCSHDGEHWRQ
jgi:hypothetical protein